MHMAPTLEQLERSDAGQAKLRTGFCKPTVAVVRVRRMRDRSTGNAMCVCELFHKTYLNLKDKIKYRYSRKTHSRPMFGWAPINCECGS
jgi:hypothetical protein